MPKDTVGDSGDIKKSFDEDDSFIETYSYITKIDCKLIREIAEAINENKLKDTINSSKTAKIREEIQNEPIDFGIFFSNYDAYSVDRA
jgi:hypothetical protein